MLITASQVQENAIAQLFEIQTMKCNISSNITDMFSVQYWKSQPFQFCPSKTEAALSKMIIILSSSNKTSVSFYVAPKITR